MRTVRKLIFRYYRRNADVSKPDVRREERVSQCRGVFGIRMTVKYLASFTSSFCIRISFGTLLSAPHGGIGHSSRGA